MGRVFKALTGRYDVAAMMNVLYVLIVCECLTARSFMSLERTGRSVKTEKEREREEKEGRRER